MLMMNTQDMEVYCELTLLYVGKTNQIAKQLMIRLYELVYNKAQYKCFQGVTKLIIQP